MKRQIIAFSIFTGLTVAFSLFVHAQPTLYIPSGTPAGIGSSLNSNVGIGVSTPNAKLDVIGTVRVNNNAIYLRGGTDSNHGVVFDATIDGPRIFGYQGVCFGTMISGYSEKMRIASDGKVLIGNPATVSLPGTYKLYVETGILTEKLKIAIKGSGSWADYVFSQNYKLTSLEELEMYVQKNKHLPNIPSGDEMVKGGLDVAEMDAKLLEKIEELTLYVIDLNKQIKALKENPQNR